MGKATNDFNDLGYVPHSQNVHPSQVTYARLFAQADLADFLDLSQIRAEGRPGLSTKQLELNRYAEDLLDEPYLPDDVAFRQSVCAAYQSSSLFERSRMSPFPVAKR